MAKAKPAAPKLEFAPDAWERFTMLVQSAAKMGPVLHPPSPSEVRDRAALKKKAAKKKRL